MTGLRARLSVMVVAVVGSTALAGCVFDTPSTEPGPGSSVTTTTAVPSGLTGAAAAVAYVKAKVGLPYCYGGTGPSCYDCSGLTYMAWRAGGLTTIPRTSGAQFTKYPRVALNALRPGDLLFPADPNQHVAMYIGSGRMVHATKTGDFIKDVLVSSYPVVYAVRPQ